MPYANPEERKKFNKQYYLKHKEEMDAKSKKAYIDNREERLKYAAEQRKNHPEQKREWFAANPIKVKEYKKRWRTKYREQYRDASLKRKYGIDLNQYNEMLKSQNGLCAICLGPEKYKDKRSNMFWSLSVDHSHKTGKIRGLLCNTCNMALGQFKDDIEMFKRIIQYLEKYK